MLFVAIIWASSGGRADSARSASSGATATNAGGRSLAAAASVAAPAATQSIPATEPGIQRWFLRVDKAKIAFNNALFRAERGVSSKVPSDCNDLDTTVAKIVAELPGLGRVSSAGAKIAAAVKPVMDTMGVLAKDCLAAHWSSAQTDLDVGIPQQANAQEAIDAILDGDK
jgi:hypothetical protein